MTSILIQDLLKLKVHSSRCTQVWKMSCDITAQWANSVRKVSHVSEAKLPLAYIVKWDSSFRNNTKKALECQQTEQVGALAAFTLLKLGKVAPSGGLSKLTGSSSSLG